MDEGAKSEKKELKRDRDEDGHTGETDKKKIRSHRVKIDGGKENGGLKKRTHTHPPPIHPSQLVEIRASLLSACYFSLLLPHLLSLSLFIPASLALRPVGRQRSVMCEGIDLPAF